MGFGNLQAIDVQYYVMKGRTLECSDRAGKVSTFQLRPYELNYFCRGVLSAISALPYSTPV